MFIPVVDSRFASFFAICSFISHKCCSFTVSFQFSAKNAVVAVRAFLLFLFSSQKTLLLLQVRAFFFSAKTLFAVLQCATKRCFFGFFSVFRRCEACGRTVAVLSQEGHAPSSRPACPLLVPPLSDFGGCFLCFALYLPGLFPFFVSFLLVPSPRRSCYAGQYIVYVYRKYKMIVVFFVYVWRIYLSAGW